MQITFHCDRSHGWGEVPLELINRLGIAGKISRYSYTKLPNAYLEEDCDLGIFIDAMKAKGETITFKEKFTNHDSPVRTYLRFPTQGDCNDYI